MRIGSIPCYGLIKPMIRHCPLRNDLYGCEEENRETGEVSCMKPIIFSVHNTGISDEEAETLSEYCDVVWACASKPVREIAGRRSKLQIGISIPVFGMTQMGKRLILNRVLHFEDGLIIHRASLPYAPIEKQPEPLM